MLDAAVDAEKKASLLLRAIESKVNELKFGVALPHAAVPPESLSEAQIQFLNMKVTSTSDEHSWEPRNALKNDPPAPSSPLPGTVDDLAAKASAPLGGENLQQTPTISNPPSINPPVPTPPVSTSTNTSEDATPVGNDNPSTVNPPVPTPLTSTSTNASEDETPVANDEHQANLLPQSNSTSSEARDTAVGDTINQNPSTHVKEKEQVENVDKDTEVVEQIMNKPGETKMDVDDDMEPEGLQIVSEPERESKARRKEIRACRRAEERMKGGVDTAVVANGEIPQEEETRAERKARRARRRAEKEIKRAAKERARAQKVQQLQEVQHPFEGNSSDNKSKPHTRGDAGARQAEGKRKRTKEETESDDDDLEDMNLATVEDFQALGQGSMDDSEDEDDPGDESAEDDGVGARKRKVADDQRVKPRKSCIYYNSCDI